MGNLFSRLYTMLEGSEKESVSQSCAIFCPTRSTCLTLVRTDLSMMSGFTTGKPVLDSGSVSALTCRPHQQFWSRNWCFPSAGEEKTPVWFGINRAVNLSDRWAALRGRGGGPSINSNWDLRCQTFDCHDLSMAAETK